MLRSLSLLVRIVRAWGFSVYGRQVFAGDGGFLADAPPPLPPSLAAAHCESSEGAAEARALFARLLTRSASNASTASDDHDDGTVVCAGVVAVADDDDGSDGDGGRGLQCHAECAVCFEDLCAEPVALFYDAPGPTGRRVCQHFFHAACCDELPSKSCPLCNQAFAEPRTLPDPTAAPRQWFSMVDFDQSGRGYTRRQPSPLMIDCPACSG
jgi:hypothetical protein